MNRAFEREQIRHGGQRLTVYRVVCSRCGVFGTVKGGIPQDMVAKKLGNSGWHVGKNKESDVCPNHEKKPDVSRDLEKPHVDRVLATMRAFEDALAWFSALDQPKSSDQVITALTEFRTRIFGD